MCFLLYGAHLYSILGKYRNNKCPSDAFAVSTCGCQGDQRGLHQKVVAFSLYGNFSDPDIFSRYVDPMRIAIKGIQKEYSGWVVRIYTPMNDPASDEVLRTVFKDRDNVDLCNVTAALESLDLDIDKLFPMTWRFLPLLDPTVDYLMSRDTDGVFLDREVQAVKEWLGSPATFHFMRDHPQHCVYVLGGLWGSKVFQNRMKIARFAFKLFAHQMENEQLFKGADQKLLGEFIWPAARSTSLVR